MNERVIMIGALKLPSRVAGVLNRVQTLEKNQDAKVHLHRREVQGFISAVSEGYPRHFWPLMKLLLILLTAYMLLNVGAYGGWRENEEEALLDEIKPQTIKTPEIILILQRRQFNKNGPSRVFSLV